MSETQIGLPGIGQQKASLAQWKSANNIHTYESNTVEDMDLKWSAWCGEDSAIEHLENWDGDPFEAFSYGRTERLAILMLCEIEQIDLPFWWNA